MANTISAGKWLLLRYGILIPFLAIFFLFLYLLLSLYVYSFHNPPSFFALIVPSLVVLLCFQGFSYDNLYNAIKKLPPSWVKVDFDPIGCKVAVQEGKREYIILYHSFMVAFPNWISYLIRGKLSDWHGVPEHYQIWSPYRGGTFVSRNRYGLLAPVQLSQVMNILSPILTSKKQKEIVFDGDLMKMGSHLHQEAKEISSLRFAGLVKEDIETTVVMALTGDGKKYVPQALNLLKKIVQNIEGVPSSSEEWGWERES